MRALTSLLVLLMVMVFVALYFHDPSPHDNVRTELVAMLVGFLMLGAWLMGRLFDQVKLPKISGYLLFGLLVGPSAWSIVFLPLIPAKIEALATKAMPFVENPQSLGFIKDLAIAMIALTAGGEIQFHRLRAKLKNVIWLTVAGVIGVGLAVAGIVALVQSFTPLVILGGLGGASTAEWLIVLGLFGLIASGNSPSVAIAMISELHAQGPLSRATLAVTVCKDLLIIVLFTSLVAVGAGVLREDSALSGKFLLIVGVKLGGSLGIGALLGLAMAWFVAHVREHLVFFVLGACFFIAVLGDQHLIVMGEEVHFKPLLMALSAGLTMQNFRPEASEPLFHTIEELSLPVYCLFFAVAGTDLKLDIFLNLEAVAAVAVVVLARVAMVWGVMSITTGALGMPKSWSGKLWMSLMPQAGVTLALAILIKQSFPFDRHTWSEPMFTLLLGLVAVHALLGPIAYRWALISSGEAGAEPEQSTTHYPT